MDYNKGEWKVISQYACGCQIRETSRPNKRGVVLATIIEYCPKHKAATEMYEALKAITELAPRDKLRLPYAIEVVEIADKALARAEGK